jgi:hypothetical protein
VEAPDFMTVAKSIEYGLWPVQVSEVALIGRALVEFVDELL